LGDALPGLEICSLAAVFLTSYRVMDCKSTARRNPFQLAFHFPLMLVSQLTKSTCKFNLN